jgi:hypothetical protein
VIEALKPFEAFARSWVLLGLNGVLLAATALAAVVTRVLKKGTSPWTVNHSRTPPPRTWQLSTGSETTRCRKAQTGEWPCDRIVRLYRF